MPVRLLSVHSTMTQAGHLTLSLQPRSIATQILTGWRLVKGRAGASGLIAVNSNGIGGLLLGEGQCHLPQTAAWRSACKLATIRTGAGSAPHP
jgi:hypothetical protein